MRALRYLPIYPRGGFLLTPTIITLLVAVGFTLHMPAIIAPPGVEGMPSATSTMRGYWMTTEHVFCTLVIPVQAVGAAVF